MNMSLLYARRTFGSINRARCYATQPQTPRRSAEEVERTRTGACEPCQQQSDLEKDMKESLKKINPNQKNAGGYQQGFQVDSKAAPQRNSRTPETDNMPRNNPSEDPNAYQRDFRYPGQSGSPPNPSSEGMSRMGKETNDSPLAQGYARSNMAQYAMVGAGALGLYYLISRMAAPTARDDSDEHTGKTRELHLDPNQPSVKLEGYTPEESKNVKRDAHTS